MKKGKKIGIAICWIFVLLMISVFVLFYFNGTRESTVEKKEKREEQYTALVKIGNAMNLIEFSENYFVCGEQEKVCSEKYSKITNSELSKTLETKETVDLKMQNIIQAFRTLYELGKEKEMKFDALEIFSDYPFEEENLKTEIEKKTKYKQDFKLEVTYKEKIENVNPSNKYYTVSFDTDSEEKIANQYVMDGEKGDFPVPQKEGYTFIEWQLEDKKFDMETPITQNITLKAKWEKENTLETGMQEIFNLNEEITAKVYHVTMEEDTFYLLATNLDKLFPNTEFGFPTVFCSLKEECLENEITLEDFNQNLNRIKIDTKKENSLLQIFKKYKNHTYPGIKKLSYTIKNHQIRYAYDYIKINEKIKSGETMEQEITENLKDAFLFSTEKEKTITNSENVVLTEEICQEYNLNCTRS